MLVVCEIRLLGLWSETRAFSCNSFLTVCHFEAFKVKQFVNGKVLHGVKTQWFPNFFILQSHAFALFWHTCAEKTFTLSKPQRPISQCGKLVCNNGNPNSHPLLFTKSRMDVAQSLQDLSYKVHSTILTKFFIFGLSIDEYAKDGGPGCLDFYVIFTMSLCAL